MSIETTSRQVVSVLAIIPLLGLLLLSGAGCSEKEATSTGESAPAQASAPEMAEAESPAPAAETPEPVAAAAEQTAAEPAAAVDGQKVFQSSCQACHATGVAGAPKLGDKEAWAPRIAKGNDALLSSVKNGLNAMPPKGGCMGCSDEELDAAVTYLVEQGS